MVRAATPLFLALVVINLADLVFAVDSVPAIFAITTDTFIVYTSNIMAILGLRALYFALAAMVHRFHYLKYALALVLVFIGSKIFVADFLLGGDKFPPLLSLGVTFGLIAGGVVYSLWKTRGEPEPAWPVDEGPNAAKRHIDELTDGKALWIDANGEEEMTKFLETDRRTLLGMGMAASAAVCCGACRQWCRRRANRAGPLPKPAFRPAQALDPAAGRQPPLRHRPG